MTGWPRPRSPRGALGRLPVAAVMLGAVFFAGLPLYWLVTGAFKRSEELGKLPPVWFPGQPTLDAFGEAARLLPLGSAFFNSFLIAGVSTAAVVATSVAAGWAFAIYRFKGRDQLFLVLVATMFVPPIATLVPLYWIVQTAGLQDSLVGVLLPQLANAFGIFLIRQFARGVPTELLDAARVDGASEWRILVQIGVPLLRPAIATLAMFAFVFYWNSYLWPLVILQSPGNATMVLVVNQLLSYTTAVKYANVVFAGTLLAIIPNLVLFLLVRRTYQDAGFSSAVKG
jgi:multiple sugar transport system permease protein